jgi:1,2-diacylglycerol 3-alpha-glucosyltransferase
MRIAIFTDTYEPQINGVVTSIKLYNQELRKHGHEIHIFCPKARGLKKNKFVHPLRSIDFKPYPTYRIGIPTPSILRKIRKYEPDVIHIQSPASIGLLGLSVAKALDIPTVMTYHTMLTEYVNYLPGTGYSEVKKIGKKTIERYVKLFFNQANLIISPGVDTKKFLKRLVKKPVAILPTGIQLPRNMSKKKSNKTPIILQVGRLCKERSVDVIIHALYFLLKKQKAKLIITSSGPKTEELKHLAKNLGIEKNITFTGFVSEKKKNQLYKKADIFVSASSTDTQGLVPLEAMSFGTPVIVPEASGFRDFIKHNKNGLTFKSGKAKQLSHQMLRLLKNKKLKMRLSKQSIKTSQDYNIEKLAKKLEAIYYSLAYDLI